MTADEQYQAQREAVIKGRKDQARELAKAAIDEKMDLLECIEQGFGAGVREVGDLWEAGEYFLPELVQGADAMKAAMDLIQPELEARNQGKKSAGTVVIGTVKGDIHDIGKTLVATFLEANGFEVFDLGKDVPLERFVEKAREESADIICLSALLTTTMTGQEKIIQMLGQEGLKGRIAVLVGGAPVNRSYAKEIGADGYGANAVEALDEAKKIVEAR